MGGLGNILFPLAYCYNLSIERGLELVINYMVIQPPPSNWSFL